MGAIAAYSFLPKKPSITPVVIEKNTLLLDAFNKQLKLVG
jgi:hypothetical protein